MGRTPKSAGFCFTNISVQFDTSAFEILESRWNKNCEEVKFWEWKTELQKKQSKTFLNTSTQTAKIAHVDENTMSVHWSQICKRENR